MLASTYNHTLWFRLTVRQAIRRRIPDERGASLVEYALLLALIAMVCLGAVTLLGSATQDSVSRSGDSIATAN